MAVEYASLWFLEASSSLIITRQLPGDKADEVLLEENPAMYECLKDINQNLLRIRRCYIFI